MRGSGYGGVVGGGHGTGSVEFDNGAWGLTWMHCTGEEGAAMMHADATLDECGDTDIGGSDRSQALDFECNNDYVSSGFLFQPGNTSQAFPAHGDADTGQPTFPFSTGVANEMVDPGSIRSDYGDVGTDFSHRDTLDAFEFPGSVTHPHYQVPNFNIPLEEEWSAPATTEPFSLPEIDISIPNEAGPAAVISDSLVLGPFDPELLAPHVSGQAATTGSQHQDGFRQQQSRLEFSGRYQAQLQSSLLNNWPSSSAAFTTVPQLPENHQGQIKPPTRGIARGIFPGFFSNPDPSDDGLYGW